MKSKILLSLLSHNLIYLFLVILSMTQSLKAAPIVTTQDLPIPPTHQTCKKYQKRENPEVDRQSLRSKNRRIILAMSQKFQSRKIFSSAIDSTIVREIFLMTSILGM